MIKNKGNVKNKYQRSLMFNLRMILICMIISFICNLFLPLFHTSKGYSSVIQYMVLACYVIGYLNACGYGTQYIPILPLGFIRIAELIYRGLIRKGTMSYGLFLMCIIIDIVFIGLLMIDKSQFEYIKEEVK